MTANTLMLVDLDGLRNLAEIAQRNGTEFAFIAVALQWAEGADREIRRLKAKLEAAEIEP